MSASRTPAGVPLIDWDALRNTTPFQFSGIAQQANGHAEDLCADVSPAAQDWLPSLEVELPEPLDEEALLALDFFDIEFDLD